ncbi:hypothetical protein OTB20_19620 [Streptomyces sp. H27-H1]|uniref:hypothetical protein n=1 Tax=Streptomyces sp. H27-H1 TaxID=2996461 RepID=UPI00226F2915|nr:hypothetical protein [Streptomyces sp. H27-H1]MCY0928367.1 hypothetical protein [Streptomyces sp. H27-H1]
MSIDLMSIEDPEAFEFFAAARKSLKRAARLPVKPTPVADEPDLSDLTGMPDGPHPNDVIDSSWVLSTMQAKLDAQKRFCANEAARKAGECQASGRWIRDWHTSRYSTVLSLLAAAEQNAPEAERPWHAARLDSYAAAHGLRGWYRGTDYCGRHYIQVNHIRTREEGDQGRYFPTTAWREAPRNHIVVDRDTGRTAYKAPSSGIARQWIAEMEGSP